MKSWRKIIALMLATGMMLSIAACGKEEVSKPESSKPEPEKPVSTDETPRNETLYMGTGQWGPVINWNPLSGLASNSLAVDQGDMSRVLVYETLYMYDQLNAKAYPLLADGDYTWNEDGSVLTVKIKKAAQWSDGSAVTASDVAYTFDTHVKYETTIGNDYKQYITSVVAKDESTVEFTANKDKYNMLKVEEYLPKVFILQKEYLQKLEKELNEDATEMKNAEMFDAPHSGPYDPMLENDQKVVLKRNESYWGKDPSMWGKLPTPKYIAHNIFPDNNAMATAFEAGEIDVNQAYIAEIETLWEEKGLPISTYYDEAPYQVSAQMPAAVFNMKKEGLDQKVVRQAIAYAVDYDQIISSAMTGQSPSFSEFPRTLFNPSEAHQSMILDKEELAKVQWKGKEIDRANKMLDEAGIIDKDGDGYREYKGKKLSFKLQCPIGWSDWEAALSIVATAGKKIGIEMETYFPEASQWTENTMTGNFDITMESYGGGIANPWTSAYSTLYGFGGKFPETLSFNQGRYYNARVDELLSLIPNEKNIEKQKEYWQELNMIYLEEVPSFALMYRPAFFHEVNESVWTGFPSDGDGTGIPPQVCCSGYGIASLYNIHLVGE